MSVEMFIILTFILFSIKICEFCNNKNLGKPQHYSMSDLYYSVLKDLHKTSRIRSDQNPSAIG